MGRASDLNRGGQPYMFIPALVHHGGTKSEGSAAYCSKGCHAGSCDYRPSIPRINCINPSINCNELWMITMNQNPLLNLKQGTFQTLKPARSVDTSLATTGRFASSSPKTTGLLCLSLHVLSHCWRKLNIRGQMLRLSELSSSEMLPTESLHKKKLWDLHTRDTGGETQSHHVAIQMKSMYSSSCRSIAKHTVSLMKLEYFLPTDRRKFTLLLAARKLGAQQTKISPCSCAVVGSLPKVPLVLLAALGCYL